MSKKFLRNAALSLAVLGLGIPFTATLANEAEECHHNHSHNRPNRSTELTFTLQFGVTALTGSPVFTPFVVKPDGTIFEGTAQVVTTPGALSFPIVIDKAKPGAYVIGVKGDVSGSVLDSFIATEGLVFVTSSRCGDTVGIIATPPGGFGLPALGASTGEVTVSYVYSRSLHP